MTVFSVSQFIEFVNAAFASAVFPEGVAVEGEVVEYRLSQDKWIWFNLKDESGIVSCFSTVWQLRQPLEDGMKVRVFGLPKVYPKSGKFSVVVDRVELVGEGALRRAFELLKRKLEEEGVFAVSRKRKLPRFPERIGLIASRESAAYSDFLRILGNRWGGVEVNVIDVAVQGRDAISQIAAAFARFNAEPALADVLVLTRGGGSLDDLQAFNSEEVARAVFGSRIPVVVGVGHERDETLADYAADVRASTPSNAAEIAVPDRREIRAMLDSSARGISSAMAGAVRQRQQGVLSLAHRIETHARAGLVRFSHRLRDFERLFQAFASRASRESSDLAGSVSRLSSGALFWIRKRRAALDASERLLMNVDPRRLLGRGYAIVRDGSGRIVKDAKHVDIGAKVDVQLGTGGLVADVTGIHRTKV